MMAGAGRVSALKYRTVSPAS